MKYEELVTRYDRLKTERKNWDRDFEDIALFSLPQKADFITKRPSGDKNRRKFIYDPTAMVANHTLASHMHMALTSPSSPWFGLRYGSPDQNTEDSSVEWLEDSTARMMNAINGSNFVSAINEHYQDLVGFGTAVLHVGFVAVPDFQLVFDAVPLNEVMFLEDRHGRVDTVFREANYTARQAMQKWPDNDSQKIKEQLKNNPDKKMVFLNCVMPNEDYKKKDLREFPFKEVWLVKSCSEEVSKRGYYELPYMVPRWSKMSTDRMGYGPALMALPDVRILNDAKRLELRSYEKAIDPPLMGMAGGVIGDLHLEAGGFTQVRDTRAIMPLTDQANWQAVQIKSEELRKNIQSVYLIDQLVLPERPNATATEVQIRYEMMQRVLGPTMGRLQSELLTPMIERIFGIMYRNEQFEGLPDSIEGDVDIEYTGPLAKAQRANDAQAVERFFQYVMAVAQVDPSVIDVLDTENATRLIADRYGVPAKALRSAEQVAEIQQARAQEQAKAQQTQDAQMGAATQEAQTSEAGNLLAMEQMLESS